MVRQEYPKPTPDGVHFDRLPFGDTYTPDFLAFSLIIFLAAKSKASTLKIPKILRTIAEDATRYFLVIFSSHFVLEMTLTLGWVSATAAPFSTATNDVQCVFRNRFNSFQLCELSLTPITTTLIMLSVTPISGNVV